jgi:hypothetical protein
MAPSDEFVFFFTGTEIEIILLKGLLENSDVPCIVQNEINSGLLSGYQSLMNRIVLKIPKSQIDKAIPILNDFRCNNT